MLKLVFNANHGGFIANYKDMVLEKIADHCATFRGVAIDGQDVTAGEGYDWNCNLPLDFAATTTVKTNANANAIITATAVDGDGNAVAVTDNGDGTYTLPTPREALRQSSHSMYRPRRVSSYSMTHTPCVSTA